MASDAQEHAASVSHGRGLTRRQADALFVVLLNGPCSVSDLTYHLPISEGSARGLLNRLEHKGFIGAVYHGPTNVRQYVYVKGLDAADEEFPNG